MVTVNVPVTLNVCPPTITLSPWQILVSIVCVVVGRTVKFNVIVLSQLCEFGMMTVNVPVALNVCPPMITLSPLQILVSIVDDVVGRTVRFNVIVESQLCEFGITTVNVPVALNVCPPTITLSPLQILVSIVEDVVGRTVRFNVIVESQLCEFGITTVNVPVALNLCPPTITLSPLQMLVSIVDDVVGRTVKFNVIVESQLCEFGITTVNVPVALNICPPTIT